MPRLDIVDTWYCRMVIVSDVPMPDGAKRLYLDMGKDALAHIIERIRLDKDFILSRRKAKRIAA